MTIAQGNQNASTKVRALLQQKSKRSTHATRRCCTHETINTEWEDMGQGNGGKKTGWTIIPSCDKQNRVDLRKTQEMSQPDTGSIKRREVNSENGCQKPWPICQPTSMLPSNYQKSCSTQATTAPPRNEKPELGCPNKPVSPTSASVATESRPTMEDKILRTTNTICLNFSPFPPLPQAMS